jgi:hypothetical protein
MTEYLKASECKNGYYWCKLRSGDGPIILLRTQGSWSSTVSTFGDWTIGSQFDILGPVAPFAPPPNPRLEKEWTEEDGDVLWWKFPIEEPPYVGRPGSLGQTVEMRHYIGGGEDLDVKVTTTQVGGWPGYHTHWTPIPVPVEPEEADPKVTLNDARDCPFCGSNHLQVVPCPYEGTETRQVECTICGGIGPRSTYHDNAEEAANEAIHLWGLKPR